ncbi:aminotransferase class I/II-fold pyridoxal phosphate-dependent enzyme [Photobacterium sagamiensis]|uniref:aminotransferase class I/II-fold pyridoxal phosphate-dependent enzyme n=1 Tax=Photobacterium sagamiensis TaxID=2910241 RepID=UPI003D0C670C
MSIFERITHHQMDEISKVNQRITADRRSEKRDLVSGVIQDEAGSPIVLPTVADCRQRLIQYWAKNQYLAPEGTARFNTAVTELVFGHALSDAFCSQLVTLQAPGGTGALRLAFDFYASSLNGRRLWVGTPGWSNYQQIATAAGVEMVNFPQQATVAQWLGVLEQAEPYDAVLFQAGAHNPIGMMLDAEDWHKIADLCRRKQLLPILDNASQGLGQDIEKDAEGIRVMAQLCPELIVASSFSKNFTLYNERVGAVSVKTSVPIFTTQAKEELRTIVRANYSSPAPFSTAIVAEILGDPLLYQQWLSDLVKIRAMLAKRRDSLLAALNVRGKGVVCSEQRYGLFIQLNLSTQVISDLREKDGIYLLNDGRLSLASLWQQDIARIAMIINRRAFKKSN